MRFWVGWPIDPLPPRRRNAAREVPTLLQPTPPPPLPSCLPCLCARPPQVLRARFPGVRVHDDVVSLEKLPEVR